MSGNEEFIHEFLVECEENLDQLDQDLVALEKTPRDPDRLASIFRTMHTIKGTSGFFGFVKLGGVAHAGENLLGRLRDGELVLDPELADALLQLCDTVREILGAIEQQGSEGDGNYAPLVSRLELLAAQPSNCAPPEETPPVEDTPTSEDDESGSAPINDFPLDTNSAGDDSSTGDTSSAGESLKISAENVTGASSPESVEQVESSDAAAPSHSDNMTVIADGLADASGIPPSAETLSAEIPSSSSTAAREELASVPVQSDEKTTSSSRAAPSAGTIRVDVALLNELMNQVGELVLARNQIRSFADNVEDRIFNQAFQQLDLITGDLQEGIMKTRMQPIGNLWTRLPRVVRDLAQSKGKQVELELHGHETELDRTLIEAIKDPLTHLVRNSVDHGIEEPSARETAGKDPIGRVILRAFHEGGLVNIEISDDGAGIDPERVRQKALRTGLISPEQARRMSDRDITQLIFLPGLSTAERVTDISGRGVGMDVVKTNIERIGGSVSIDSHPGKGTSLRVKIPLTLAIIPALMVGVREQSFAIPQVSLREIITLFEGNASSRLETIGNSLVYRLRGELLPLVCLSDVLCLSSEGLETSPELASIVVLQAIGQRFGLIVDHVARTEEIVVKPLHKALAQLPVFSGATVLGDGRVALILDIVGLARTASIEQRDEVAAETAMVEDELASAEAPQFGDYLVCEAVPGHQIAVPLRDVTRLEEFSIDQLTNESSQVVVPYREQLLHLLPLEGYQLPPKSSCESVYVVVHSVGDRHVGLMVHRIVDVSAAEQKVDTSRPKPCTLGRVMIREQVVSVIDIRAVARSAGIDLARELNSEAIS